MFITVNMNLRLPKVLSFEVISGLKGLAKSKREFAIAERSPYRGLV
jgi:hypothetical protein